MENTRPILYGVADYAEIRRANAWFIDRTAKIRDLEGTRYAVFLRPRRFGKSLLISMLHAYYDVNFADRFEEFFGGTDIGANPTDERGRYLVLYFDFSAVSNEATEVQRKFNTYASLCCDTFARNYRTRLPEGLADRILAAQNCDEKMNEITLGVKGTGIKLYVLIDEYDNFTNTILAESGERAYNELCHGGGFFKRFFTNLKTATSDTEAPVTRLFITGVSPVTMDDVTSGFNIGTDISLMPQFADFTGFRHEDLRAISDYYAAHCGFDADKAYNTAIRWYDNYRFGSASAPAVANTTVVLSFFSHLWRTKQFPNELIDENLRTDYAKIGSLIVKCGNPERLIPYIKDVLSKKSISAPLAVGSQKIRGPWELVSWFYYLGLLSISGSYFGNLLFSAPNMYARTGLEKVLSYVEMRLEERT